MKRRVFIFIWALAIISVCKAYGEGAPADTTGIVVTGTVVDEEGEPFPRVYVIQRKLAILTATKEDGSFAISIPEGSRLIAAYMGEKVTFTASPTPQRIEMRRLNMVSVSGTVVNEEGEPVEGVVVWQPKLNLRCMTEVDGSFNLSIPEEKGSKLTVEGMGYKRATFRASSAPVRIEMKNRREPRDKNTITIGRFGIKMQRSLKINKN